MVLMHRHSFCFLSLVTLFLTPFPVFAAWIQDGIPIATLPGQQNEVQIAPDGAGGVFVVWLESGNLQRDIYAQRVDADGNILWAVNGVPVCACTGSQVAPQIVSDGAGGAFVAWENNPNGAAGGDVIHVTRIDGNGQVLWSPVPVGGGWLGDWEMMADGNHGAIITWDNQSSVMWAQRFDGAGEAQWTSAILANEAYARYDPHVVPDGAGGFLVNWMDARRSYWDDSTWPGQTKSVLDLYMQRLDLAGTQLAEDGKLVRLDCPSGPSAPGLTDGAAIAFENPVGQKLSVQRITSNGDPVWLSEVIALDTHDWLYPHIVSDGADGFVVVWRAVGASDTEPYAQRLGPDGSREWAANGVPFFSGPGEDETKALVADGLGGFVAIVGPSSCCGVSGLQRVDGSGQMPWGATGVPLSNATLFYDHDLLLDGVGGVYCAWCDYRDGHWNIYLQRFDLDDGSWGDPVAVAISSFDARASAGRVTLSATFRSDLAVEQLTVYRGAGDGPMQVRDRVVPDDQKRFVYIDEHVTSGQTYRYQIGITDSDGEFVSPVEKVTIPALEASLEQNHPNPFNPSTTIRFSLPSRQRATLVVHDSSGRLVRTLMDGVVDAGTSSVEWNGRNETGTAVTSGVYFYRLTAGKYTASRKMLLLK